MHRVLSQLQDLVESARSMPMSASCVVNRGELLSLVDDLRAQLPEDLVQARQVLGNREAVVQEGRRRAQHVLSKARQERARLVEQTDVAREARAEAGRILADAERQAEAMRAQAEDYVDAKLATFEVVLTRTLEAVERGREKLSGRHDLDYLREQEPTPPG